MPLGEALTLTAAPFSCLSAQEQKTVKLNCYLVWLTVWTWRRTFQKEVKVGRTQGKHLKVAVKTLTCTCVFPSELSLPFFDLSPRGWFTMLLCGCVPAVREKKCQGVTLYLLTPSVCSFTHRHTHTYTHLDACRCMWLFFYNQLAAVALRSSDRKTELEGRYFLSKPSVTIAIPPVCCSLSVCSVVLWLPTAKKLSNQSDLIICTVKEKT